MLSVLQQIGKVGVVPVAKVAEPVSPLFAKEEPLPVPNIHHLFKTKDVEDISPVVEETKVATKPSVLEQLKISKQVVSEATVEPVAKKSASIGHLFGGQLVINN